MNAAGDLALIVRSAPWQERSGREALDLALSAVTMDLSLDLFFVGAGLQQLLADRKTEAAAYPGGLKAWAALPELGSVNYYAERAMTEQLEASGAEFVVPLVCVEAGEMAAMQQLQRHVLVL